MEENPFLSLTGFVDKGYFKDFLDKIDNIDENTVKEAEDFLKIDIGKMKEYIDEKIPKLLEEINERVRKGEIEINRSSSLRDILGNSIIDVFDRIIFVLENFKSDNPSVRRRIDNPDSGTRTIIKIYSEAEEGESKLASYYIDSLCKDYQKLKAEMETKAGYLEKFSDYFCDLKMGEDIIKNYPTGAKKLPFFRFFSELEKFKDGKESKINGENFESELKKLNEKDRSGNLVIDKEKIREDFLEKE